MADAFHVMVARLDHVEEPGVPVRHTDLAALQEAYPELGEWLEELQHRRDRMHEDKIILHEDWVQLQERVLQFLDDVENHVEDNIPSGGDTFSGVLLEYWQASVKHIREEIQRV